MKKSSLDPEGQILNFGSQYFHKMVRLEVAISKDLNLTDSEDMMALLDTGSPASLIHIYRRGVKLHSHP